MIKCVLQCNRSSPFTKRTLDFITSIFKEIINFEKALENKRHHEIAARQARGDLTLNDDSMNDELGTQLLDPDQTITDSLYISSESIVEVIFKKYLLEFLSVKDINVRSNSASLIKKILDCSLEIFSDTFEQAVNVLKNSTFDKDRNIRSYAILSLKKFHYQDDSNQDSKEATDMLLFHLFCDPDYHARFCALKVIDVNQDTLNGIFKATRDCNAIVRKEAFKKIAENCKVYNFRTEDRLKLLKNGYFDEPQIKEVVMNKLIRNWADDFENNIIELLEYLNISQNKSFLDTLIQDYFQSLQNSKMKNDLTAFHKMVFDFKINLDEKKLFKTMLTKENTYTWYNLCLFCKKNNITYKKTKIDGILFFFLILNNFIH